MKPWLSTTLALVALMSPLTSSAQTEYYRYKDKDGNTVMSSALPPEVANDGYEVLNAMGEVVEKVPPRKSEAQLKAEADALKKQQSQQKAAEIQREQAEIQERKDEILLKSFSNLGDIERARNDKMASIQVLEEIVKENLEGLEKQLTDAKNAAASYKQGGQKIPDKLQTTIDNTMRQISESKAFLERKSEEKKEIQSKYEAIIIRFKELQQKQSAAVEHAPASAQPAPTSQPTAR